MEILSSVFHTNSYITLGLPVEKLMTWVTKNNEDIVSIKSANEAQANSAWRKPQQIHRLVDTMTSL